MGQFFAVSTMAINDIVANIVAAVTDETDAVSDLSDIVQAFNQSGQAPPVYTNVASAALGAINASAEYAVYIFTQKYGTILGQSLPYDCGVVLNYAANGNSAPLVLQLAFDLREWGLDSGWASAIAETIQPQVASSAGIPLTTYGQVPVAGGNLCWVASYGIFTTSQQPGVQNQQGVIWAFCAANR